MNSMIHKNKRTVKKTTTLVEGILPFTEKPSNSHFMQNEENGKNDIQASDLFSLFTANIIKEEVTFVR